MDFSPTRRRMLQFGGTAAVGGLAGCLGGGDQPEETLDFDKIDRINESTLPSRRDYRTPDARFPKYRRYDAANADTVLILLHTVGFDSRILQPLATAIADANAAHVFTPDLRGHGPQPEKRGDIDYIGQYEDDVRYLIESATKLYPESTVIVGGHGTGGGIAVRFGASRTGSLADGYLLLAPFLGPGAPTTRKNLGGWAAFATDRIVMLRVLTGFGIEGYRDMTTVTIRIPERVRDGTETLTNSYRVMASYTPRKGAVTKMGDSPCLTVVGSADEAMRPDAYESVFSEHPNAAVELVEGASHLDLVLGEDALDPFVEWLDEI